MAKRAKKKTTSRRSGGGTKRRSGTNRVLIFLILTAMVPFSLPTILVMFVGLLPAIVAAIAERGENRYAWICVGGLNFAGVSPWLFSLWFGHHTLEYALGQVTNVTMLLVSYGAAAVGWVLYMAMPIVVGTVMAATSQHRAVNLASNQRKLVELWGDGVVTPNESL